MNLKQFGAALVAATTLIGTVSSCSAAPPAAKQGRSIDKSEDELTNWADPWQPGLPVPTAWELVVHRLIDINQEHGKDYFGVALIRNVRPVAGDDPCIVLLGHKNDRGQMGALMLSRHNSKFRLETDPLGKDAFTTWILTNGLECSAEAVKAP